MSFRESELPFYLRPIMWFFNNVVGEEWVGGALSRCATFGNWFVVAVVLVACFAGAAAASGAVGVDDAAYRLHLWSTSCCSAD